MSGGGPTHQTWDTMGYSRQAGGTHPTEMLSCMTYISGIKYVNQPSIGTSEYY